MDRFKKGDWVEVLDTPNIRGWGRGKNAIGFKFQLDEKQASSANKGLFISPCNTYCINYTSKDVKIIKNMAKTKAKAAELPGLLNDRDYFSATYGRKKIRGIVENIGSSEYPEFLLHNSFVGKDNECTKKPDFPYAIELDGDEKGTIAELKAAGITNYIVLKDKRQKAIVEKDRMPTFDVPGDDWKVRVEGQNFVFGCGDVELTRKQIEGYLRWRKNVPENLKYLQDSRMYSLDIEEIETYLAYKKAQSATKGDVIFYNELISACDSHLDEEDINDIPKETIKELFKYMDWMNSK